MKTESKYETFSDKDLEFLKSIMARKVGAKSKKKVKLPKLPHEFKIEKDGNFTVAVVYVKADIGRREFFGVSKRNPKDVENDDVGRKIAISRAVSKYVESIRTKG